MKPATVSNHKILNSTYIALLGHVIFAWFRALPLKSFSVMLYPLVTDSQPVNTVNNMNNAHGAQVPANLYYKLLCLLSELIWSPC